MARFLSAVGTKGSYFKHQKILKIHKHKLIVKYNATEVYQDTDDSTSDSDSEYDSDNSNETVTSDNSDDTTETSDCGGVISEDNEDIISNNRDTDSIKNVKLAVRNCKKIQYNQMDVIAIGEGVKVYKGKYEENVESAVKVSPIDVTDMEKVTMELASLDRKLNKTVRINQKLMSTGNDNIVKYFGHEFDHVNQQVHLLIALEQCDCNLHEFVRDRSKLPRISNNEIYIQLARGLHFLHSRKIVHRDVKPSNVLMKIEQNGEVVFKLSDFGMAKTPTDSESSTSVSGPCGTYGWMAPEVYTEESTQQPQHVARRFLKKSDIFPLGQIFYFVASNGCYVFKNQAAIQSDTADFTHISCKNIPFLSLLRSMFSRNYMDRPYADKISHHPALWTASKTLEFFQNASELLDEEPNSCLIEINASNVVRGGWQQYLSKGVEKCIFPSVRGQQHKMCRVGPKYRRKSVQSLIRAVRNNKTHYPKLSSDLKKEFGSYPENYLNYWTIRFPELLMHAFTALGQTHPTHDLLKEFYC